MPFSARADRWRRLRTRAREVRLVMLADEAKPARRVEFSGAQCLVFKEEVGSQATEESHAGTARTAIRGFWRA